MVPSAKKPHAAAARSSKRRGTAQRILALDIGGTHAKMLVRRTAQDTLGQEHNAALAGRVGARGHAALAVPSISIGYPGLVGAFTRAFVRTLAPEGETPATDREPPEWRVV